MANDLYVEEAIKQFQKEWHDVLGKVSPKVARQLKNTLKIHVSNMRSFLSEGILPNSNKIELLNGFNNLYSIRISKQPVNVRIIFCFNNDHTDIVFLTTFIERTKVDYNSGIERAMYRKKQLKIIK